MPVLLAAFLLASPSFTEPEPWALGFAAPPRMPFVGDVDHDGYADMIGVYPPGDAIIDVNPTIEGVKSGPGFQGLAKWGHECQAAAVGEIDDAPGTDVVGLFDGKKLRLAGAFKDRHFTDVPDWVTLPNEVKNPAMSVVRGGSEILIYSTRSGQGYRVDAKTRKTQELHLPAGTVWLGDAGDRWVTEDARGTVSWLDPKSLRRGDRLGTIPKDSRPAAAPGLVAFGDQVWTPAGIAKLEMPKLPVADSVFAAGDLDHDGDADLLEFRYGKEAHTGNQVIVRRFVSPGETDNDHDGLSNDEEAKLGTNPNRADTDDDALLDGWEVNGYRGLDLKGLGCDPKHVDLLCLISRFQPVQEAKVKGEMDRVIKFYADLNSPNLDGTKGMRFHPIYLPEVTGDDQKNPWWTNRAKFRPEKWQGVVHWMQVTPGGGGQADELGDGGGCGEGALWAVFVHEFGHQIGLNHEGFWPNGSCPIYGSLMNYNYSYSFEDSRDKIHYSDGSLAGYVLRETDLDETIPLPYDRVKFLEKGPYHFRLKPNGQTTLVDWNWNGVFGEKHIKADINYAYSTNAGRRDDVGKTRTSPWLFTHAKRAYVIFGTSDAPADPKVDPTLSPEHPGRLMLRRLRKPFEWDNPWIIDAAGVMGDPVAFSWGAKIVAVYQTKQGVVSRRIEVTKDSVKLDKPDVLVSDPTLVPSVGEVGGQTYLMLWNPATGGVSYHLVGDEGRFGAAQVLDAKSTCPPGICENTITHEAVVGLAQDQDDTRKSRWQVRRYKVKEGKLEPLGMEWIEGEAGQARGSGRITVLFDRSRDAGPNGRLYFYGRGLTGPTSPWACTYVAHQIADKTVHGGWLVKRYYDEWTQSRSAPAAAWFGGDVIWAYRWVDGGQGPTDNNLHVGYGGLGIQSEPFGDHDDIGYIRSFGIRNSLLTLGRP
jgi:hypothetical protein